MNQVRMYAANRRSLMGKYTEIAVGRDQVHAGHVLLVNRDHPVKRPPAPEELLPVQQIPAARHREEREVRLEQTCLRQLNQLLQECHAAGRIVAVSGYRSKEAQARIYAASVRDHGPAFTASYVARPNESEHQTGLAVDVGEYVDTIDYLCPSFPDRGVCRDFKRLAADYGFIQRYEEGKEPITGIACEPWHFRYVGFPHSRIITQNGMCLEEYIDIVKQFTCEGPHLIVHGRDGVDEVYYVPAAANGPTTIPVVHGVPYRLSGNNQDGFIVTVLHRKGSERRDG